jgi:UDP-N-acetylmuramoyl-L-alanine---L-glutamate ligase
LKQHGIRVLDNARVGIWGTGREGIAVAHLALGRGSEILFVQDPPASGEPTVTVEVAGETFEVAGPEALRESELDVVVRSPGVSVYREELQHLISFGVPVTTATAIWFDDYASKRVIGVTGSKGKTTTASLTALALEASGLDVGLGGNIGTPVTDFYDAPDHDAYVIEVSSFQAADLRASPGVGVLTLLSPDHLDWHGSYEQYVSDKLNLFAHRSGLELAVNARSPEALRATAALAGSNGPAGSSPTLHPYGPDGTVRSTGSGVTVDGAEIEPLEDVSLRGRHNLDNLCGAITAARLLTGFWPDFEKLARAIASMPVLQSRLETVAVDRGIEFVDDALASNPAGNVAALDAFHGRRVSLIAGGHDRGTEMRDLASALDSMNGATLVYLGDAGAKLDRELASMSSTVSRLSARSVEEAVEVAARALAGPGVVLFSPGAPTPAEEGTYLDRSARFKRAVREYVAKGESRC